MFPKDNCTTTGQLVLEMLREKHPDTCIPDVPNMQCSAFKHYPETPEVVPLDISRRDVAAVAGRFHR
eukprot:10316129-Ditylum_brightwellii.AAC.2